MEQFPKDIDNTAPSEQAPQELKANKEEILFRQFIEGKLFHSFSDELEKVGYTPQQMQDFYRAFDALDHRDKMSLLAFPWELKQRAFPAFLEKVNSGMPMQGMLTKIIEASRKQSRAVAYHCSDSKIEPKMSNDGYGKKVMSWTIQGTEPDHRDNDLPMAYYSFDYYHLYREKNPSYIYIISIQKDQTTGHRRDNNQAWGRAPSLTVIDRIDIRETDDYIRRMEAEHEDNKKQAA